MTFQDETEEKEDNTQENEIQDEQVETNEEIEEKQTSSKELAEEYLNLARVIQADFDNYRKRSLVQIEKARIDGISSAVEILLPSLDAFKKVKENVKDENTLAGIEMLEKSIESNLSKLGVEKIQTVGLTLDPNVHNALAVAKDESKEDGEILEEFQAGYKLNDKVIRCSQVLVNNLN